MSETLLQDPEFPKHLLPYLMENQKLLKHPRLVQKISFQRLLSHFKICANSFREKNHACKKYNFGYWERFKLKDKYFWKWIPSSRAPALNSYLPFWDTYSLPGYPPLSLKAKLVFGLIFKRSSPKNQFTLRLSNESLAKYFNYHPSTITHALKELHQAGLIKLVFFNPNLIATFSTTPEERKTRRYIQLSEEMIEKRIAHLKPKPEVKKKSLYTHKISPFMGTHHMVKVFSIHQLVQNIFASNTQIFSQFLSSSLIINDSSPFCYFKIYSRLFLKRIKLKKIVKNNNKTSHSSKAAHIKYIKYNSTCCVGKTENVHNLENIKSPPQPHTSLDSKNLLSSPNLSTSLEAKTSNICQEEAPSVFSSYQGELCQASLEDIEKSFESHTVNSITSLSPKAESFLNELTIKQSEIEKRTEEAFRLAKEEEKARLLENPEKYQALREACASLATPKSKEANPFSLHVFPEEVEKSLSELFSLYPELLAFVKYYGLAKALSLNEDLVETLKIIVQKVIKSPATPTQYLQGYIKNEFLYLEAKKVHKKREAFAEELHKQYPKKYKLIKLKEQLIGIETAAMRVTIWGINPFWNTHNLSYKEYFTQNHMQTLLPKFDLQIQDLREWSQHESAAVQRYIIKKYEQSSLGAIGFLRKWYERHVEAYKEKYERKEKAVEIKSSSQPNIVCPAGISVELMEKRLAIGKTKIHKGEWFWDHTTRTFQSSYLDKNPLKAPVSVKKGDEYSEKIWRELGA